MINKPTYSTVHRMIVLWIKVYWVSRSSSSALWRERIYDLQHRTGGPWQCGKNAGCRAFWPEMLVMLEFVDKTSSNVLLSYICGDGFMVWRRRPRTIQNVGRRLTSTSSCRKWPLAPFYHLCISTTVHSPWEGQSRKILSLLILYIIDSFTLALQCPLLACSWAAI